MRIPGLILLGLLGAGVQQPRPATSIRGVVVQTGTSEPVAKAIVRLAKENNFEPLAVSTGPDGRFEFQNVAAGTYNLTATRAGFLSAGFGQRGPSGSGGKLTVAGSNIDIRLLMTATGSISGRVFDNTGEPLANVPVQALKYSYEDGQRILTQVKVDETNDLGEFRLFWLPPGQYTVSAQPLGGGGDMVLVMHDATVAGRRISFNANGSRLDFSSEGLGNPKPGEAYVPVYYPGTADPQSASRVEVRPGADLRGIDFILAQVTTRKVRGSVINGTTGQPADVANIQLVPRSNIGNTFGGSLSQGKFEVSGVLPGAYFLVALSRTGPRDDIKIMGGRTSVDVGYVDLDNINVTLHPAMDIAGSVSVEGSPEGLTGEARPILFLQGRRDTILPSMSQAYASFSSSTQFQFNNVVEGDYQIWWDKLPPGIYIKSVMFGAVDALNSGIHIDPRTADRVQIVMSGNAGSLEGVVRDNLRNVVPRARVVLIPDVARRQRADLYQSTLTDESGRFRLQGIPPGDYSLFAWEDIENDLWQDAEFLKRHESSGRPVRIIENGRETIEAVAMPFAF